MIPLAFCGSLKPKQGARHSSPPPYNIEVAENSTFLIFPRKEESGPNLSQCIKDSTKNKLN